MKRRQTYSTLYVPTLLDKAGARHIIPGKDRAAYCGVTDGSQHFPHDHKAEQLCQRCVQQYMKVLVGDRLEGFGL